MGLKIDDDVAAALDRGMTWANAEKVKTLRTKRKSLLRKAANAVALQKRCDDEAVYVGEEIAALLAPHEPDAAE